MTAADGEAAARRMAADIAYGVARSSILRIAEEQGAQVGERPLWPGAAVTLQNAARRAVHDYVRLAREDRASWQQIGEALGLAADGEREGYDLAVAAYEHIVGKPDPWHQPSFAWTCADCGRSIADRGPYDSHPEDNEHGHNEACARIAALTSAWQAERDT
jgi:hypothetical protein